MSEGTCGVGKHCSNPGTNERLIVVATPGAGLKRRELVFRLPICNEHLQHVPENMKFEGFIALGDDAVSAD